MACDKATAPVNISEDKVSAECDLKCYYKYDYPLSTTVVTNKGNYLDFDYTKSGNPPVEYNSLEMTVSYMRLYIPSLHTFNNTKADGEIIISHVGNGESLLVCIPIKVSIEDTPGAKNLKDIIALASKQIPSTTNSATFNIKNFTLNNFIPKGPYYSYTATLPYEPCSGSHNYIVFDKLSAIPIDPKSFTILSEIILKQEIENKPTQSLYYNKTGAVFKQAIDPGEGIYIDCQPTGDDGKVLYQSDSNSPMNTNITAKQVFSSPATIVLLSLLGAIAIINLIKYVRSKIGNKD